jgi:hypothetical protein
MIKKIIRIKLIVVITILAITSIYGGFALMIDRSGSILDLSTKLLEGSIYSSYLFPGIILLIFLGVFPTITAFGLITRKKSRLANKLNIYKKSHWAWAYSLYCGIILILWIDFQVMIIGGGNILQSIYAILGVVIIVLALMPSVMKFYKKR